MIAALGGEGGSVLMNWIVAAARASGLPVQATSVPGVAQRTGATSYYIELLTVPSPGAAPVFALVPMPGRVDVLLASELVEAARMMERGFVSPNRTTLITSTSRTYVTTEKIAMGDGRFDDMRVEAAAGKLARRVVALDLDRMSRQHSTMVSATLFGALAGSGVLPWPRETSERAMGGGQSYAASLAGFASAFAAAAGERNVNAPLAAIALSPVAPASSQLADLPAVVQDIARLGMDRVIDFQDHSYGTLYLERLRRLNSSAAQLGADATHAIGEAARRLALWMAYEDVPRVADLKTRPERFARIRQEAELGTSQVVAVTEYLKPGPEEIADMLPAGLGRLIMRRLKNGKSFPLLGRGVHVRSTGVFGFAILRVLAGFKKIRRRSLRFVEEQAQIEIWLDATAIALGREPIFAGALAELPRLLKGYGDTHARGRRNYAAIMNQIVQPALATGQEASAAPVLRRAIAAALADPDSKTLSALIAGTAKSTAGAFIDGAAYARQPA